MLHVVHFAAIAYGIASLVFIWAAHSGRIGGKTGYMPTGVKFKTKKEGWGN